MSQSLKTEKQCGKEYIVPHVDVIDIDLSGVVCASIADTENYDVLDPWALPDIF